MEEVDNIILDSLRNIQCDIDESIHCLRDFNSEIVFGCIVRCIEVITPSVKFPHKLPPSMSVRLKVATSIAEHIKELGYRSDMGYQTVLYCNEVEKRRVLMFLVERLPRESSKTNTAEELGYVPKLVKKIEICLGLSFEKPWVSSNFLKYGTRACGDEYLRQDFGHCYPLQTENLQISYGENNNSEVDKQYWIHLPDVTQQCSSKNLIPSLLFKDSEFSSSHLNDVEYLNIDQNISESDNETSEHIIVQHLDASAEQTKFENKFELILRETKEGKSKLEELQSKHKNLQAIFTQMEEQKFNIETRLQQKLAKYKTRSKTLMVLSSEENMIRLKNLVQEGTNRLLELANQWHKVQTPLLGQYRQLKENLNVEETEFFEQQQKLESTKEKCRQLVGDLKEKDLLEQHLLQEYENLNKNTNRSAYTRRILEIIGNIKKQNEEITKILEDTKAVQKEINILSGKLDRSFTLSDELIFSDAKRSDMARKAYILLAAIHTDCSELVQAVTDLGLVERECRNLQEQVDAEMARETFTKLERVNADLADVKKETALLLNNIKG